MWGGSWAPVDYINWFLFLHFVLVPALTFTISCVAGWFYHRVGVGCGIGILIAIISVPLSLVISVQGNEMGYVVGYFDGGGYLDLVPAAVVSVFVCYIFAHLLIHLIYIVPKLRARHIALHRGATPPPLSRGEDDAD